MRDDALLDASTAIRASRSGGGLPASAVAATIVAHPTAARVGERFVLRGPSAEISRSAPDFLHPGRALGAPLGDPFISRRPVGLAATQGGGVCVVPGAGGTAVVVAGEPARGAITISAADLARGVPIELAERVVLLLHQVVVDAEDEGAAEGLGMVGTSAGMRRVRAHIERIADLLVPVLIRGETGTGKELVARAVHERSARRGGPFVSVNLGAIPRELAAAELFGALRGAYTGAAQDRPGLFRAARGGTLFLDEIGEASPEVQVMLLRVLESGEMYPVGAPAPVQTDARLLAATDADLEQQIRDGHFKAPLLHRLSGYEVRLPPLRERREDIGLLFVHFAREELEAVGEAHKLTPSDPYAEPWLPAPLASRLVRGAWPGNLRQLRNVARQLVIGSRGKPCLQVDARLAEELSGPRREPPASEPPAGSAPPKKPRRKPSEVSEAELREALAASGWDLQAAADRLGLPRPSIYDLIEKSPTLRTAGDVSAEEIARCHQACGGDVEAMAAKLEVSARALKRRMKELGLGAKRG